MSNNKITNDGTIIEELAPDVNLEQGLGLEFEAKELDVETVEIDGKVSRKTVYLSTLSCLAVIALAFYLTYTLCYPYYGEDSLSEVQVIVVEEIEKSVSENEPEEIDIGTDDIIEEPEEVEIEAKDDSEEETEIETLVEIDEDVDLLHECFGEDHVEQAKRMEYVNIYHAPMRLFSKNKELNKIYQEYDKAVLYGFGCLNQDALGLPTGCEVTSLAMALNYRGYAVDATYLSDACLPKGERGRSNPYQVFVGDPRDSHSYGCYAPVIVSCATNYGASVTNVSHTDFPTLLSYIDSGRPVVVWATSGMQQTKYGSSVWDNYDGTTFSWRGKEHCLVLTGYDAYNNLVYLVDPQKGYVATYNMALFYYRWNEQDRQAVLVN